MKALLTALLAARKAAGVLPRDETSPASRDKPAFSYPSADAIQEEARHLEEAGLLLYPDGVEQSAKTATFSWILEHVESGERRGYVITWPLFSDITEPAHALAAAWSHCLGRLLMQLLALRVAARVFVDGSGHLRPARDPAPDRRGATLDAQVGPMPAWSPSWQGAAARSDMSSGTAPARPIAVVPRTEPSLPPAQYSDTGLADLVSAWVEKEAEHDAAEGRPATRRTLAHAWAACSGERLWGDMPPLSASERERLFFWLLELRERGAR